LFAAGRFSVTTAIPSFLSKIRFLYSTEISSLNNILCGFELRLLTYLRHSGEGRNLDYRKTR
jgi:hypothetical protein